MTAQTAPNVPDPDDPVVILRLLPQRFHAQFRAEYAAAVEDARRPEGYRALHELLRLWRLRAVAYSDPSYDDRQAAAHTPQSDDVPLEQLLGDRRQR